ncbi:hypothetical protein QUF73_07290 [Cytobacillus sp. NJ13]|nr:hypothetical protein [Cytobacillus sp. NJ13]
MLPGLSEMDKSEFQDAIDRVIQAKILFEMRGLYPPDHFEYYASSDEGVEFLLSMICLGNEWTQIDSNTNDNGVEMVIMNSPELKQVYKEIGTVPESIHLKFQQIIKSYHEFWDGDFGEFTVKMLFCEDGNIGLYFDFCYGPMYSFFESILLLKDRLQALLEEIRQELSKESVA